MRDCKLLLRRVAEFCEFDEVFFQKDHVVAVIERYAEDWNAPHQEGFGFDLLQFNENDLAAVYLCSAKYFSERTSPLRDQKAPEAAVREPPRTFSRRFSCACDCFCP